jgi:hypothetical protein
VALDPVRLEEQVVQVRRHLFRVLLLLTPEAVAGQIIPGPLLLVVPGVVVQVRTMMRVIENFTVQGLLDL